MIPTAAAAARPLGSPAPAPTRPLVPLGGTLLTRYTMQPPAPRESRDPPSSTPWSVVVARHNRHKQLPPPTPRTDRYLELPVSRFTFRNKAFPPAFRVPIKDHATEVHETLWALTGKRYRLNRALALATQDRTPLSDRVVNATLRLRDLLEAACDTTDGAQWLHDTLRKMEMDRANRTESSASDSSTTTGQRRREEPSSGRGNSKRATFSGSDSDSGPHPQRTERDRRQVPPAIFHAAELDGDTPSFPPRIFRPRITQRLPSRAPIPSTVHASEADSAPSLQQMVEAVTAAAIAAVDRHLAHMGLCPAPTVSHTASIANTTPPTAVASNTVPPFARTAPVAPYTGSAAPPTYPATISPGTVPPFARTAPVAPYTGHVAPPTYPTTISPGTVPPSVALNTVPPFARTAPVAPYTGPVAPPTYPATISPDTVPPFVRSVRVAPPPPSLGTVNPYIYPTVASTARPAPASTRTAPSYATSFAPALNGPLTLPPPDERILNDDSSSLTSDSSSPFGLRADFVASLQAAYRTLDMRRVPRVQPLQFPPSADRTAATQLLIRSMRDALSGIFDVADPTGTVTLTSPVWVPGWHAPLLKLTKTAIAPNRDDAHDLHRLTDDLFFQLQERMTSGSSGPAAFKTLLTDFADYFDRAPRGSALATLQNFGVRTGTPFASYLRALRVVVASTVEKGGPLAPSAAMAIELVRIRTAQQYPMLMPTLFPGDLATREKPYVTLTSMWTAFGDLKHNMSPAIDGDAFASASRTSSSHAPPAVAVPTASAAVSQRHYGRPTRPSHAVSNVPHAHSRRDPFRVDYGLWPFGDKDYDIVCTVTNHMLNTNISLWTPLLTEDARRQACIQYSDRCCNCGSTDHSLRWCPSPFTNIFFPSQPGARHARHRWVHI